MKDPKALYFELNKKLRDIEIETGAYLADICVDSENAGNAEGVVGFWSSMLSSAKDAAASRAEDAGVNLSLYGVVV